MKLGKNSFFSVLLSAMWLVAACMLISLRGVDWTDEGLYLYDAWAFATGAAPQSSPLLVNQGYLLGSFSYLLHLFEIPYLIVVVRLVSVLLWGIAGFLFSRAARLPAPIACLTSFLVFQVVLIPTQSYQTLPLVLSLLSLCLLSAEDRLKSSVAGLLGSILVVAYVPGVITSTSILIIGNIQLKGSPSRKHFNLAWIFGTLCTIAVYGYEWSRSSSHIFLAPNKHSSVMEHVYHQITLLFPLVIYTMLLAAIAFFVVNYKVKKRFQPIRFATVVFLVLIGILLPLPEQVYFLKQHWWPRSLFLGSLVLLPTAFGILFHSPQRSFVINAILIILFSAGLESLLGGNDPFYYLSYASPFLWILIIKSLLHFEHSRTKIVAYIVASTLSLNALYFASTFAYRSSSITMPTVSSTHEKLKFLSLGKQRAQAIENLRTFYIESGCESAFFGALNRTPLAYVLVNRKAPWGMSWVKNRSEELRKRIIEQDRICLVFRSATKGEQLASWLELKNHQVRALGEGKLFFLVSPKP